MMVLTGRTHHNNETQSTLTGDARRRTQTTLTGEAAFERGIPIKNETQNPTVKPKEGELRVFYQNVNGIKLHSREWEDMVYALHKSGAGVFGMAETKYN